MQTQATILGLRDRAALVVRKTSSFAITSRTIKVLHYFTTGENEAAYTRLCSPQHTDTPSTSELSGALDIVRSGGSKSARDEHGSP